MSDELKRRAEDLTEPQTIDELVRSIYRIVNKIDKTVYGNGQPGLCERMDKSEIRQSSTQTELTEHKLAHWQYYGLIIGVSGVAIAVMELIKR